MCSSIMISIITPLHVFGQEPFGAKAKAELLFSSLALERRCLFCGAHKDTTVFYVISTQTRQPQEENCPRKNRRQPSKMCSAHMAALSLPETIKQQLSFRLRSQRKALLTLKMDLWYSIQLYSCTVYFLLYCVSVFVLPVNTKFLRSNVIKPFISYQVSKILESFSAGPSKRPPEDLFFEIAH